MKKIFFSILTICSCLILSENAVKADIIVRGKASSVTVLFGEIRVKCIGKSGICAKVYDIADIYSLAKQTDNFVVEIPKLNVINNCKNLMIKDNKGTMEMLLVK